MLTADGEKSKSPKHTKVQFLLVILTYVCMHIHTSVNVSWCAVLMYKYGCGCIHTCPSQAVVCCHIGWCVEAVIPPEVTAHSLHFCR